jgi:subtilisin family serine protease
VPRALLTILAVLAGLTVPSTLAHAQPQSLVEGEVVVRYDGSAPRAERTEVREEAGARAVDRLPVRDAEVLRVPASRDPQRLADALERLPGVRYAEPVIELTPARVPSDEHWDALWGMRDAALPAAWDIQTGRRDVIVAIVDTGVDGTHPDLAPNMWRNVAEAGGRVGFDDDGNGHVDDVAGWNFVGGDGSETPSTDDLDGHGTHVAGIAGAVGDDGVGVAGVAWHATLMPLRFIGGSGTGTSVDAAEAIVYAARNGARVINASFVAGMPSAILDDAIRQARDALVVAAAGNDGLSLAQKPTWPCLTPAPNVVCVGATDPMNKIAGFSNYGTEVDVGAPGVAILSTQAGGGYLQLEGTSMSTPMVSGAAALMLSQSPWASPSLVAAGLRSGGTTVPADAFDGRPLPPRLDAARSLEFITDDEAPLPFEIVSPAGRLVTKDRRASVAWTPTTDAASGIERHVVTVDGAAVATAGPSATSAALPGELSDGLHRVVVVAEDRVGNGRDSTAALIHVDYAAPRPASVVIIDPAPRRPAPLDISWAPAVDDGGLAYHEVVIDSELLARVGPDMTTATIPALPHGRHLVSVRATDLVGNVSESARVPVNVDDRAPVLRLSLGASAKALARGRLTVRCRPSEAVRSCAVRVALAGGRGLTRRIVLTTKARRVVRLSKLARRAIARAARRGNVRLVLTATATDTAGNGATAKRSVTRRGAGVRRALAR